MNIRFGYEVRTFFSTFISFSNDQYKLSHPSFSPAEIRAKEALSYEQKVEATYSSLLQDSIRNQDSVSVQLSKLRGQVQTLDEEKSDLVSYISEHFENLEEELEVTESSTRGMEIETLIILRGPQSL